MLRGISPLISPELLKVLSELGHGDTIVFADANFPSASNAIRGNTVYLRLDGQAMLPLLDGVLELLPLDEYVDHPVCLMQKEPRDAALSLPILDEYISIVSKWDKRGADAVGYLSRSDFYAAARSAACIVQTGETAIYANIILQKGVVHV